MYQLSWPSISWPCSAPHQKLESQVPRPPPCSDSLSNSSAKLCVMSEMSSSNSNCSALISARAVSEKARTTRRWERGGVGKRGGGKWRSCVSQYVEKKKK